MDDQRDPVLERLRRRGPPRRRRRDLRGRVRRPFGAGHYDDARRAPGRGGARQPRVRQPGRRRRPPPGRDRVGPRLGRRDRRAALGPACRADRVRLRARRHRRDARAGPSQRGRGRCDATSSSCTARSSRSRSTTHRSTSSSRTASSCCRATRTPRSPRSPGCCAPAAVSGSATSSAPSPTTAHRPPSRCAAGAITPAAYEDALRHAGLGHVEVTLTDAIGAGLSNADHPRRQAGDVDPSDAREDWPAVRDIYEAGCHTGSSWRLPMSVSTRRRISSRIGRTASTPRPAGWSSSQSS